MYEQVGKRVHAARARLGISQETLAKLVFLTRTSITNIERGRQRILLHTLMELASALRVPVTSLLPDPAPPVGPERAKIIVQEMSDKGAKEFVLKALADPNGDGK